MHSWINYSEFEVWQSNYYYIVFVDINNFIENCHCIWWTSLYICSKLNGYIKKKVWRMIRIHLLLQFCLTIYCISIVLFYCLCLLWLLDDSNCANTKFLNGFFCQQILRNDSGKVFVTLPGVYSFIYYDFASFYLLIRSLRAATMVDFRKKSVAALEKCCGNSIEFQRNKR